QRALPQAAAPLYTGVARGDSDPGSGAGSLAPPADRVRRSPERPQSARWLPLSPALPEGDAALRDRGACAARSGIGARGCLSLRLTRRQATHATTTSGARIIAR